MTAHPKYPRVFSPFRLGPVELRNRFYSSPHAVPMTVGSKPSDDYIHYNVARVKDGGCGLIMLSMAMHARGRSFQPCPYPRENIAAFGKLADEIHAAGGKIFAEPWYYWGAAGQWQPMSPPAPAYAPSEVQFSLLERGVTTREISVREIALLLEAFQQTVGNLRQAGFDGVMVHAAHGALAEQFLSPYFNRRDDDYGGSLDNRMRFLREILQAGREAAGENMAVGVRLNCDELLEGGYHTRDAYQILKRLADEQLIDFADLDIAVEPNQFHLGMPSVFVEPHVYRPYVEAVREAAGKVPVLSVLGRLTSIADAEAALESGVCDMIGAARALIAEPRLVQNAHDGQEARSRTCIACNWCMAAIFESSMGCTINPESYRERYWGEENLLPAPRACRVVIVGAGPAGLEAARVSALRGHTVILLEARERLGGALELWSRLPGREFYHKSIDWWERELSRLGVEVRTRVHASAAEVLSLAPDAVLLATGARYNAEGRSHHQDTAIPGYELPHVHCPEEILKGEVQLSGHIVMLDAEGMHTGVGVAEMLANSGARVQLLTPHFAPFSPRLAAGQDAPFIMQRLRQSGVELLPNTYLKSIAGDSVEACDVYSDRSWEIEGVDAVVLSTGRHSVNPLEAQLEGAVAQLFSIGDAMAARIWASASFEGHKFARLVGEPDAPGNIADVYFGTDDPDYIPYPADQPRG